MRWPGAPLPGKRLANFAACWRNMKGAGDDHRDECCFTDRDAIVGMGFVAFSLAGNGDRRCLRGCNGLVPSRGHALSVRRRRAGLDAAGSVGDFLLLLAATFYGAGNLPIVSPARSHWADGQEQNGGEGIGSTFPRPAIARRASLAGRGMAAGGGLLQSAFPRRIFIAGARTPQTVEPSKSALTRDLPQGAMPSRSGARDRLLRMQVAAGSCRDWMVSPGGLFAGNRDHRTLGRTTGGGDRPRTGAHPTA